MNFASFYGRIVPAVKRMTGIKDISLLRKRWQKRIGKIIYHKKYDAKQLTDVMISLGMKAGSVVCIHSSMMQFYNYKGTAQELIDEILRVIGPDGTLMMPAFPVTDGVDLDKYIFDVCNSKTGAGYLAETFRKYPGVKRSLNVRHSVCAIGKHADYLTSDHHKGHDCWDKHSPWFRMCELNGLVFNLGMPRSYMGTFHHCVESVLQYEHPYWAQFFNKGQKFHVRKADGEEIEYTELTSSLLRKTRKKNILSTFTDEEWRIAHISNLEVKVFDARKALDKMLELGRKGKSVYIVPSPSAYEF